MENQKVRCSQQVVQSACGEQADQSSVSKRLDEDSSDSSNTFDQEHDRICKMSVISCDMCLEQVKSKDIDSHLKEKCVMREIECMFCDKLVQENMFTKHYDICESALVRCGNKCGVKISRKDLSEHYRNKCPKALVVCEDCENKVERQLLEDHHAECVTFSIPCPESCGVEVVRKDVERHLDEECQKLFSACAYKEMQCSFEGFPAGMKKHMKEGVQHHMDLLKAIAANFNFKLESVKEVNQEVKGMIDNLQMKLESEKERNQQLEDTIGNLQTKLECEMKINEEVKGMVENLELKLEGEKERNEELQREIYRLRHGSILWKVKDIAQEIEKARIDRNLTLLSPPFYSSKHGYQLRVMLHPVDGGYKHKEHLGVFIQVMAGEYDSLLQWPFIKRVTFRLVDQETKGKDIVRTIERFDSECCDKPKNGKCNEKGQGFPKFLSHKKLNSGSYIVDNAIFLEVSVEE